MKILATLALVFCAAATAGDILKAIEAGDLEKVKTELAIDIRLLEQRIAKGQTLLHRAAEFGKSDVALLLLDRGAKVDEADEDGNTPLHRAIERGHYALARTLIEKDASILKANNRGQTALHLGARGQDRTAVPFVEFLLNRGMDVNMPRKTFMPGLTPLHEAVAPAMVKLLLERRAKPDARDQLGDTPLLKASYNGIPESIALLLDHKADVNARNQLDVTPLHAAASNGQLETAMLLLERGADINAIDRLRRTPLDVATDRDRRDPPAIAARRLALAKFLRSKGGKDLFEAVREKELQKNNSKESAPAAPSGAKHPQ